MKMFRRIFALALAIVMVCLFSASAFATSNYDYYVHKSLNDMEGSHVYAAANIERYETSGFLELTNGAVYDQHLYIKLEHTYIDVETGAAMTPVPAPRSTTTSTTIGVSKVYNNTLIRRMVSATYTFELYAVNLSNELLEFDDGPETIVYNEY